MSVETMLAFAFGVSFVGILLLVALRRDKLEPNQFWLLRVIMALAAAGVAAMIPGFISIQLGVSGRLIQAGGALAVFIVVYRFNPPPIKPP